EAGGSPVAPGPLRRNHRPRPPHHEPRPRARRGRARPSRPLEQQYATSRPARASSLFLGPRQPSQLAGVAVALLRVAVITALILPLRQVTPVVATGMLYLVVVLLVSVVWGVWLGLATSVVSALSFNYFHIPPTGRLTIAHTENVVALVVFFIAAVVASSLARPPRRRTPQGALAPTSCARAPGRPTCAGARPT